MKVTPNIYKIVTDKIIEQLEKGEVPWQKHWKDLLVLPKNLSSKKTYRGINVWLLLMVAEDKGYKSPYWLTYRQAKEMGGNVKKGEKSTLVVFWKLFDKSTGEFDDSGAEIMDSYRVLRYYNVFNYQQTENILPKKLTKVEDLMGIEVEPGTAIPKAEKIVTDMQARNEAPKIQINNQITNPKYTPSTDTVTIQEIGAFEPTEFYYAAMFHELAHSTGHEKRLKREKFTGFGRDEYSKEELVAEFGAAILCGVVGIEAQMIVSAAAYIQNWLSKIREDEKLVVCAAAKAQKAVDYILGVKHTNNQGEVK